MKKLIEFKVEGFSSPIIIIHLEEDDTSTVEIPHMHLSEDCNEWLFNDVDKDQFNLS